ncbi:hypothetical protein EV356DRAFT_370059 [Viridothelium virens]|uniref:Uncharacterized protein n=1 Tax=Viridothelium virens TaxID=1048519 RepID=A0A6A6GVT8_VIRVR|nr:hypothetical protein EV356DRAFT_370059 [Viridothelium virens]
MPIMRAEDESELLKILWISVEFALEHEWIRTQLALLIQHVSIIGNRLGALLSLRYEHLKVTLLRDSMSSEWLRPLIKLTFKNTKGYLGLEDANTFGIPDVPSEPCLLLCPQLCFSAQSLLIKPSQPPT